jgi:hypothetical protein
MELNEFKNRGIMINMFYIGIALTIVFVRILFRRYFPIFGVPCISNFKAVKRGNEVILDSRDYNESNQESILGSIQIPYAYLARYHHEIPDGPIHLVVNNRLDRNLSIRFLRKKGFHIQSYSLTKCPCR